MINSRIALSMATIGAAGILTVGATFAFFSSSASNENNTFGAGNIILKLNGFAGSGSTNVFSVTDAAPGTTAPDQVFTLENAGSIPAATTKLTSINVTPTGIANLGNVLNLTLYDDVDASNSVNGPDTIIHGPAPLTDPGWNNVDLGFGLGGTKKIIARINFDSDAGDSYQGTSVSFNFNFEADQ